MVNSLMYVLFEPQVAKKSHGCDGALQAAKGFTFKSTHAKRTTSMLIFCFCLLIWQYFGWRFITLLFCPNLLFLEVFYLYLSFRALLVTTIDFFGI